LVKSGNSTQASRSPEPVSNLRLTEYEVSVNHSATESGKMKESMTVMIMIMMKTQSKKKKKKEERIR